MTIPVAVMAVQGGSGQVTIAQTTMATANRTMVNTVLMRTAPSQ